jgi:simple sugar transport system ATP-binding protein
MAFLEIKNLSKHFGAIEALRSLSFSVEEGEIVGLMGDNGAGKSTAVKIIAGNFPPSGGEIFIQGQPVFLSSPVEARKLGIEVVYQNLALCDNLSAAANIFLGRELTKQFGPFKILDRKRMKDETVGLFSQLKSETSASDIVKRMSGGQRQAVAIARAIRAKAKLVIMDEPTAAISIRQVNEVLALIKRLKDQGVAVILISHRMPDIFDVCERVVVLRRGVKVADKPTSKSSPEEVTGLITGAIDEA